MNDITIRPEMTWREYNALRYGKLGPIGFWAVLAMGIACLASSAALMWATAASILAGLALAAFIFIFAMMGLFNVKHARQAYERYKESDVSFTFTNEEILTTWRYGQSSFAWPAIDRVMETRAAYSFVAGNRYVFHIPKRSIPPHDAGGFMQLLRTHSLLKER